MEKEKEMEDSQSVGVHAPPTTGSFPSADLQPLPQRPMWKTKETDGK